MRHLKPFLCIILCFVFSFSALSQARGFATSSHSNTKFKRKLRKTVWTIGGSLAIIDDDGKPYKELVNISSWNLFPIPTKLSLEGYYDKGFSFEGSFTVSRYKGGKTINNEIANGTKLFLSFDANTRYDLNNLIGDTKFFSPYAVGGLGYTFRALSKQRHCPTFNFGLGFTIWLERGIGINVQSLAKFGLSRYRSTNYLMHTIGVVYRFNLLYGYRTPNRLGHSKTKRRYNLGV